MNDLERFPDALLSECFAVEVVKEYRETPLIRGDITRGVVARFEANQIVATGTQPRTPLVVKYANGKYGGDVWPSYAMSADAVLPLLEREPFNHQFGEASGLALPIHVVILIRMTHEGKMPSGSGETFARAACIALIRRARANQAVLQK